MKFYTTAFMALATTFSGVFAAPAPVAAPEPLLGALLGGLTGGNTVTDPVANVTSVLTPLLKALTLLSGQISSTAGGVNGGSLTPAQLSTIQVQVTQVVTNLTQTTQKIITIARSTAPSTGSNKRELSTTVTDLSKSIASTLNQISTVLNVLYALPGFSNLLALQALVAQVSSSTGGLLQGLNSIPAVGDVLETVLALLNGGSSTGAIGGTGGGIVAGLLNGVLQGILAPLLGTLNL